MEKTSVSTAHIEYLERNYLDTFEKIDLSSLNVKVPEDVQLLKINGIINFWESQKDKNLSLRLFMEDIISGLFEGKIPLLFAIFGQRDKVEIITGTFGVGGPAGTNNIETIKTSLKSSFQGIELEKQPSEYLADTFNKFNFSALLTGMPTKKAETEQIERMIRGLYGREWGYIVQAKPVKNSEINLMAGALFNEMRIVMNFEKSSGMESPVGKRYKELLHICLTKLNLAKSQGLWHTATNLYAIDQETLNHVKALAKSVFGGKGSLPDRIRTIDFKEKINYPGLILTPPPEPPGQFNYLYGFVNTINSADLSSFIQLPCQEMPGYRIRPYARFNVSTRSTTADTIEIGKILDQGNETGNSYRMPLENLNKHGLIVGTTGSGKTNTLFYLLKEVWAKKIPFLVIEPVKTEYRKLLLSKEIGNDLQVFTLGNNNISPFRINPFEIMPGVSVQSHIDHLKAVFNASFFMWGPLPQVLERCVHEIYTDKGWDLTLDKNLRGIHRNANPTFTDFYNKVDDVVSSLGYSEETTMEVKSALKTRINSLRIGAKGLMLDTRKSIPFAALMNKPTILELESMGDDEEKSFMMGLVLTMMYEYYISQGISEGKELGHVTVIEEAHRLLANYASENPNVANVKGKAVETFTNILSEIRAYGEGFLIAEQIPTKLALDLVKNTNLKVMHRIVAEDDRKIMGATMNIKEREITSIVSFNKGEAAVFSEGDDSAYHLEIPYSKIDSKAGAGKDDDMVVKAMGNFRNDSGYCSPFEACIKYCTAICRYKNIGDDISSQHRFYNQMSPLLLSLIDDANFKDSILLQMLDAGKDKGGHVKDQKGIKICSVIHCCERYFEKTGSQYYWYYEDVENLKNTFLEIYMDALEKYSGSESTFSSGSLDKMKILQFKDLYKSLCNDRQPYPFCRDICNDNLCIYRFNLNEILEDEDFDKEFVETINEAGDDMWEKLYSLCNDEAEIVLPGGNDGTMKRISLCLALQKSYSKKDISRRSIGRIIKKLSDSTNEIQLT